MKKKRKKDLMELQYQNKMYKIFQRCKYFHETLVGWKEFL